VLNKSLTVCTIFGATVLLALAQAPMPIDPYSVTGYAFAQDVVDRGRHLGEDVHANIGVGTPVRAVADGTVVYSLTKRRGYGQYVVISHAGPPAFVSVHGHLSRQPQYPLRGDGPVKKNDIIGYVGSKAENGGFDPHLHFAIYKRGHDGYYHYYGNAPNESGDDVDFDIAGNSVGGFFTKPSVFVLPSTHTYNITDLGTLSGYQWSGAHTLNSSGTVVGHVANPGGGETRSFIYGNGTLTDLRPYIPHVNSYVTDINDSGVLVGYGGSPVTPTRAFVFNSSTNSYQHLFANEVFSYANSINAQGLIVGEVAYASPTFHRYAYLYNNGTVTRLLEDYTARGINTQGTIVGDQNNFERAFVYKDGVTAHITPLTGDTYCVGLAINDNGQVLGYSSRFLPDARTRGWVYSGGNKTEIVSGSPTVKHVLPLAINNHGDIVGVLSEAGGTAQRGFLYRNGTVVELNTLISSGSGWHLYNPEGINDAGQIVGIGINPQGAIRAFLLTPTN